MLCPLLPGVADDQDSIEELVQIEIDAGAEEFYVEAVPTAQALQDAGYDTEAVAVDEVRNQVGWSAYVVRLVSNVQRVIRRHCALNKLRFLLYPSNLTGDDAALIRWNGEGVIWLGKS